MEEVLTIRVLKGTRRSVEKSAWPQSLTLSESVCRVLEVEQLMKSFEAARASLIPQARKWGIYTDEDAFEFVS